MAPASWQMMVLVQAALAQAALAGYVGVEQDPSSGTWWLTHNGQRFVTQGVNHVNNGGPDDGNGDREAAACRAGTTHNGKRIPGSPLCGDTLSYSPEIGYAPYYNATMERHGSEEACVIPPAPPPPSVCLTARG